MVIQYVTIGLLVLAVIAIGILAFSVRILLHKQRRLTKTLGDMRLAFTSEMKELNKVLEESLTEAKQINRQIAELTALQQAEMTGDFEIVEEPVAPKKPVKRPPPLKTKPVKRPEPEVQLEPPPQSFPSI